MGLLKARKADDGAANDGATNAARPDEADIPSLDHADPAQRRRAVQALSGDPASAAALVAVLTRDADNRVRQAAFLALATLNSESAAQGLAELLSDADPALRNGALETLAAMPEHALPLLDALGRHADPDVRIFAVLLASELEHGGSADWLIAMTGRDEDANVASHLAEALGGCGRTDAVLALEAIAARFADEPFLAFAVDTAIQRLRGD